MILSNVDNDYLQKNDPRHAVIAVLQINITLFLFQQHAMLIMHDKDKDKFRMIGVSNLVEKMQRYFDYQIPDIN